MSDYMADCIHLHACRRMAKVYRDAGAKFAARGCDEGCTCYQRAILLDAVSIDDALDVARDGISTVRAGVTDPYDVYAPQDFPTIAAYEIENGERCADDGLGDE